VRERSNIRRKRVLYIQYANPAAFPPLEHSSRILAADGWDVLFLGVRSENTNALRFPACDKIEVKLLRDCPAGWKNWLRYLYFLVWVATNALLWRPTWIYASDLGACMATFPLAVLSRRNIIYHEHDLPLADTSGFQNVIFLMFRGLLARRASVCIVPNEERAKVLQSQTSSTKTVVVWNCPTLDEVAEVRNGQNADEVWLLYQGSIVPPRLPVQVLHALRTVPPIVKLRVIGYETVGHKGYVACLKKLARELGIENRFQYVGSLSRAELLKWCRQSDIGLSLMPLNGSDLNMTHMTGASNKAFEYLSTGMALLVSDLPDWNRFFVEPGYAVCCNPSDVKSIENSLTWFLRHPKEMRDMGERGRKRIFTDWNYENQFARILSLMNSVVG
jgi:glycosyltransferase involved in cell wall biosynthesis